MRPADSSFAAAARALALTSGVALTLAACGSGTPHASGAARGPLTRTALTSATTTATTTTATTTLPGTGRPEIVLGDKNTPEQFVLGELYVQALQSRGFSVSLTRNIGPPSVSLSALQQGSLDLYPEYLDVWLKQVVGDTSRFASVREAYATAQLWADEHGLVLLRPTPFSDTDGLAATAVYAGAHHLRSLEDLRRLGSTVTLGAPIEFEQDPSGLAQLEQAYGFKPAATRPIDIGSQYEQLRAGLLQATWVTTTDGQLATPEFVVLRDTRHVFGFGNVIPVVPKSVVTSEGPAFVQTIDQVDALLSPEVMRELNAQATLEAQDPATIAHDFLVEHGVLPPSGTA